MNIRLLDLQLTINDEINKGIRKNIKLELNSNIKLLLEKYKIIDVELPVPDHVTMTIKDFNITEELCFTESIEYHSKGDCASIISLNDKYDDRDGYCHIECDKCILHDKQKNVFKAIYKEQKKLGLA